MYGAGRLAEADGEVQRRDARLPLRRERVCPRAEEQFEDDEGGGEVLRVALQVALRVGQGVQLRQVHAVCEGGLGQQQLVEQLRPVQGEAQTCE
tara:strand:- start:101 stop:382 length:282 start_codon:yes stop_codon:yes gene_type:complete